jgi:hypothetical protein
MAVCNECKYCKRSFFGAYYSQCVAYCRSCCEANRGCTEFKQKSNLLNEILQIIKNKTLQYKRIEHYKKEKEYSIKIKNVLTKVLNDLPCNNSDLLSIVGSWYDTLSSEEVLEMLSDWYKSETDKLLNSYKKPTIEIVYSEEEKEAIQKIIYSEKEKEAIRKAMTE